MLQNLDYICQINDLEIYAGLIHRDKESSFFIQGSTLRHSVLAHRSKCTYYENTF
jgi:hypothetical protein